MDNANAADERLRQLAGLVTEATDRPGVILGPPPVLAEICRLFGFKNQCSRGSVYLTAPKMRRLGLRAEAR